MTDLLPEIQPAELLSPADRSGLERTHGRAMAAMVFALHWQDGQVRHADCLVAPKLNLWRDILPFELEQALLDRPAGHTAAHRFAPGELVPAYREADCLAVPDRAFNRKFRKCWIEPRAGRFYPRGFVAGVRGIYAEDLRPVRVAEVKEAGLTLDLNHPLAGRELTLEARILDTWEGNEEHGGACNDVGEMVTGNGPGMQARWRNRPSDFWSDLPFTRLDPAPDANFYAKPRITRHLDRSAGHQLTMLYGRLLPQGARVLDLMSSCTSHLPQTLAPAALTGLGMNAEELAANPLLTERLVHDLNLEPRLPYADAAFDAVICNLSVEYLTKPMELFAEVRRVLRPGGLFIVTFSNRWFPPKVVNVWQEIHEFERPGLVLEYFLQTGGFDNLQTWSLRGLPRPPDDKYAGEMALSDPLYAVWGKRVG